MLYLRRSRKCAPIKCLLKVVSRIFDHNNENDDNVANVILFPKTIQYYQVRLTRMLETEQYAEAIQLLKFLLQCQGDDRRAFEEWRLLLEWLQTQLDALQDADEQSGDMSEADMLAKHVQARLDSDQYYMKKLLDMLLMEESIEKKFIALDQLVYIDHPNINDTLKRWIETVDLNPLVQFKVLQTLKLREVTGHIHMYRNGEKLEITIEDVPLHYEEYPQPIVAVLNRVQEVSEVNHPALSYFAEQTWKAFLSHIYGTLMYAQLSQMEGTAVAIWAAALHYIATETTLGLSEAEDTFELYGLSSDHLFQWEQAYRFFNQFIENAFQDK